MPSDFVVTCVDDDEAVRDAMAGFLGAYGVKVQAFSSAECFLRSGLVELTSCLITDIKLPGMSGLLLLDCLIASNQQIPTIIITAFTEEHLRIYALNAGAICFLSKPIFRDELLAYLGAVFNRQHETNSC